MNIITHLTLLIALLFGLLWIAVVLFLRLKKKKSISYLFFFTVLYVYLFKVLDYTLFQFQSLLLLKHFVPGLMLKGTTAAESINLVPLLTLTSHDLKTSLLNILLMTPFGFLLPFITNFRMRKVVVSGMVFSLGIELLQLITGLLGKVTFRVTDINDVLFNTIGAAAGYILFDWSVRLFSRRKVGSNPISRYVINRPQVK